MNCSGFNFGERNKIANAYSSMNRKSLITESCHFVPGMKKLRKPVKRVRKIEKPTEETLQNESVKKGKVHRCGYVNPLLRNSKKVNEALRRRLRKPVKRVRKNICNSTGYCITDGEKTLCTNDKNESYFNRRGIVGETRVYESAIDALHDVKKVRKQRKAKKGYSVRKCGLVGESFRFLNRRPMVNEGWFDGVTDFIGNAASTVGNAVGNTVGAAVDTAKGAVNTVGNVAQAAGSALQGDFSGAGSHMLNAGKSLVDTGKNVGGRVLDTAADAGKVAAYVAKPIGQGLSYVGSKMAPTQEQAPAQNAQTQKPAQPAQNAQAQKPAQPAQQAPAQAQKPAQPAQQAPAQAPAQNANNAEAESIKKQIEELTKKLSALQGGTK